MADLSSALPSTIAVLFQPDTRHLPDVSGGESHHLLMPMPLHMPLSLPLPLPSSSLQTVNTLDDRSSFHFQDITDGYSQVAGDHQHHGRRNGSSNNSRVREKKHGCWMCHKSFDRPSTLRKHLLVHTGEKAYVCETCGRRFGVPSNLNRHVRRCILRPVNSRAGTAATTTATTTPAASIEGGEPETVSTPPSASYRTAPESPQSVDSPSPVTSHKRARARAGQPGPATDSVIGSEPGSPQQRQPHPRPAAKRRRRAPSPSPWIPFSLLAFDLNPVEFHKSTPVPLPPVSPSAGSCRWWSEERDSFDENVGLEPYHRDWKGKLPGPGLGHHHHRIGMGYGIGLGGRDVGNLGGVGEYFMGRLSLL